jgi:hypothetical protein
MDKLSKEQKDEYAVSFAILALYDGEVSEKRAKSRAMVKRRLTHDPFPFETESAPKLSLLTQSIVSSHLAG